MVYVGGGAWVAGVPARNLTAAEWEVHRETVRACEAASGVRLYVEAERKADAPAPVKKKQGVGDG